MVVLVLVLALLVLALLVVLEIDLLLLLLLAFLRNACLLVAIPSSEHDMAVLRVLVVQLAVAKEEEEGAVNAVPEDRGVMTVHLGGVRHMGCGDVVVDQFRLGFIVINSIFD